MKILADDGTEHATIEACLAHEAQFPFIKLFNDVEAAVAQDAAFAARIEALGTKLARDRLARGESRRPGRKAKEPPLREITGRAASADIRADEGHTSDFSSQNEGEAA